MDDEWMVLTKTTYGHHYNRSNSEFVDKLSSKLRKRYNVNHCVITPSGMCAISTFLHTLPHEKMNIVFGSELYYDTPDLIEFVAEMRKNISIFEIDVTNEKSIITLFEKKLRNKLNVLFVESCSNPSGFIFNPELIPKLRSLSKTLIFAVDNTWLSISIYNPFEHYADFVILSLTKYYSAGSAMAGAILTNSKIDKILTWTSINGLHVSPYNAKLIFENIDSIDERIKSSSTLTLKLIDSLKNNLVISHPYLPNHSSNSLAQKYFKFYPSVFTFNVSTTNQYFWESDLIEQKPSFGTAKSRIIPWTTKINGTVMVLCRISIGFNDDYDKVLNSINEMLHLPSTL